MISFKEFAYDYYQFCKRLKSSLEINNYRITNSEDKILVSSLFTKKYKYPELYEINRASSFADALVDYYKAIVNAIKNETKFSYPEVILNFVKFAKECEKCFFYENNKERYLFVDIDEINEIYSVTINCFKYIITYKVQNSAINLPTDYSYGGALSFMNDDDDTKKKNSTVMFANITVTRTFGEQEVSEFKFINGSSPSLDDRGDEILFQIINDNIKKVIFDEFNYILDNVICEIAGVKINTEEVLSNGKLYIWRC